MAELLATDHNGKIHFLGVFHAHKTEEIMIAAEDYLYDRYKKEVFDDIVFDVDFQVEDGVTVRFNLREI